MNKLNSLSQLHKYDSFLSTTRTNSTQLGKIHSLVAATLKDNTSSFHKLYHKFEPSKLEVPVNMKAILGASTNILNNRYNLEKNHMLGLKSLSSYIKNKSKPKIIFDSIRKANIINPLFKEAGLPFIASAATVSGAHKLVRVITDTKWKNRNPGYKVVMAGSIIEHEAGLVGEKTIMQEAIPKIMSAKLETLSIIRSTFSKAKILKELI